MVKCCETLERLETEFPLCCKEKINLFNDAFHHVIIMQDAADRLGVPLDELVDFFYKGKLILDTLKKQEEVLTEYVGQ